MPTLWDIAQSLYAHGQLAEYEAMKKFIIEFDQLKEQLWQLRVPL